MTYMPANKVYLTPLYRACAKKCTKEERKLLLQMLKEVSGDWRDELGDPVNWKHVQLSTAFLWPWGYGSKEQHLAYQIAFKR